MKSIEEREKNLFNATDTIAQFYDEIESFLDILFGKMGRARTATDPAPLGMAEITVVLKPKDKWRKDNRNVDKSVDCVSPRKFVSRQYISQRSRNPN